MNARLAPTAAATSPVNGARPDPVAIRPTRRDELDAVCRLYQPAHDPASTGWLLGASSDEPLRSFVAVDGDEVVGHAGYTLSAFRWRDREVRAVFCVDWIVDGRYRGRGIGSRLFEATFPLADVGFEYGGTPSSKKLFVDMGFEQLEPLTLFVKVRRPVAFAGTFPGPIVRRLAKSVLLAGRGRARRPRASGRSSPVRLAPYAPGPGARASGSPDCVVSAERPGQLAWYLACPALQAHAFRLERDGAALGIALCLVHEHPGGTRTGRIAHLSYLGPDPALWRAALAALEDWLAAARCAMISAHASHPRFVGALRQRGFVPTHSVPVWLRDPAGRLPRTGWHLTGLEGDIGYRKV